MQLQSFAAGKWQTGTRNVVALRDATTGAVVANSSADGLDYRAMLEHARQVGGPNLRKLTFHERSGLLKALAKRLGHYKDESYNLSHATGATKRDSSLDMHRG